jgi:hypothetical protein
MIDSARPGRLVRGAESIPFAMPEEMFIIKICASRRRGSRAKELQDIADAEFIAERLSCVNLVGDPFEHAIDCLKDFLPRSTYPRQWWEQKLECNWMKSCTWEDWFQFRSGQKKCGLSVLSAY